MNAYPVYTSTNGVTITIRPTVTKGAGGKPVTSSRDVARYFGKPHNDVLKAIRALLSEAPAIEGNFSRIELDVKVGFGTRKDPAYLMDRDGFTLLAMGFTGPKALQFKMAYIAEFNAMEAELKARDEQPAFQLPDFSNPIAAARAWADDAEQKLLAQQEVAELAPKAEALDAIATADGLFTLGAAAKNLGRRSGKSTVFQCHDLGCTRA
ncbi:Rha family transcriptional regulator [Xanthobacter sp. V0B-10]|uniref:Rha family transcriptional regulator n=1 Tax=Xanthobacter albus TaxID=3119929 RepID=UPI003728697F